MATPVTYCTIEGCGRRNRAHGMCVLHYTRFVRHGDPHHRKRAANGECLEWLHAHARYAGGDCLKWPFAVLRGRGYVDFNGHMTTAGRAMCILAHGEPPSGAYEAAHSCGKGHEGCVNPRHLSWKTSADNHADKLVHGTDNRGAKHPCAVISESDAERIIVRGEPVAALAKELGIGKSMIHAIRAGKAWRHVHERLER